MALSKEAFRRRAAHYRKQYSGVRPCGVVPRYVTITIPPEVLADRDRRAMLLPQSLTASMFGDPRQGESALERRQVKSPSIAHDSLDDLIFRV